METFLSLDKFSLEDFIKILPGSILMIKGGRVFAASSGAPLFFGFDKIESMRELSLKELFPSKDVESKFRQCLSDARSCEEFVVSFPVRVGEGRFEDVVIRIRKISHEPSAFFCLFEAETDQSMLTSSNNILTDERVLMEREKLAAVGKLAAGITHELNTPVTYVRGNMQTFSKYYEKLSVYLDEVHTLCSQHLENDLVGKISRVSKSMLDLSRATLLGTDRIVNIVESMSGFIRKRISEERFINILVPARDAVTLVYNRLKHAGYVNINGWRYEPNSAVAFTEKKELMFAVDSQRVCQLFVILLNNSIEAWMEDKRNDQLFIDIDISVRGTLLVCSFKDNAGGMEKGIEKKVFEPFFTTRAAKGGTGLGMAIASQIVKEQNGKIVCENHYGHGVCWKISMEDKG